MTERDDIRWGLARRFEFIEWRAYWVGRVNRGDLEERFGVSTPQASADLGAYLEAAPGNIEYDPKEKAYLPTEAFSPKFLRVSADRYLLQLNAILNGAVPANETWFGSLPPAAVMEVTRSVEPDILRRILFAISRRQEIDVEYMSLTNARLRSIAPHSLGFDGHRWHTRAWCPEHRDFRDYVLSRILSVKGGRPSDSDPTYDCEWNTEVELKIIAHPDLDAAQRAAIERDFGMEKGVLKIATKAALAFYLIRRLNLDSEGDQLRAERRQIFLVNRAEVEEAQRMAKAKSREQTAGP